MATITSTLVQDTTPPAESVNDGLYSKLYALMNTAKARQGKLEKLKGQSAETKSSVSEAMLELAKTVDIPAFLATVKSVEKDWKNKHKAKTSPPVFQNPKSTIYKAWKLSRAFDINIKEFDTESSLRPVVREAMKELINSGINLRKMSSPEEVEQAWSEAKTRTHRINTRVDEYSKLMNLLSAECLRIIRSGDDAHIQSIRECLEAVTEDIKGVLPIPTARTDQPPQDEVTEEIKAILSAA